MGGATLVECVQSKRAKAVLRHLTAATGTGNVVVEQAWAAMDAEYDEDDVRHAPRIKHAHIRARRARSRLPRPRSPHPVAASRLVCVRRGTDRRLQTWLGACFKV